MNGTATAAPTSSPLLLVAREQLVAEGPGVSVANYLRGLLVVPALDGKWNWDTDFPQILPHSTFSFCAKLICRCLLKLNSGG